jgi:hypothetical protein
MTAKDLQTTKSTARPTIWSRFEGPVPAEICYHYFLYIIYNLFNFIFVRITLKMVKFDLENTLYLYLICIYCVLVAFNPRILYGTVRQMYIFERNFEFIKFVLKLLGRGGCW